MSALHERTQKRICRAAFFALCALPALGTLAWIVWRQLPWQESIWERRLGAALELDVDLVAVVEPRPGRLRARRLVISIKHRPDPLLELQGVDAALRLDKLLVVAQQATLHVDHIVPACRLLADRLGRRDMPVELRVAKAAFVVEDSTRGTESSDGALSETLAATDLSMRWTPASDPSVAPSQLVWQARLCGDASQSPVACSLAWTRSGDQAPVDQVFLDVAQVELPVRLLGDAVPGWRQLGPAKFSGVVRWQISVLETQGAVTGRLLDFPLQTLMGRESLHRIHGETEVELTHYAWRGPRLEKTKGSLRMRQGTMSRSLWEAGVKQLFCETPQNAPLDAISNDMRFDCLDCRFEFDQRGLALWGDCPAKGAAPEGTMVVRDGRPLLLQPPYERLPAGAWVNFLARPGLPPSWVPGTREAIETASRLPLPE